MKSFIKCKQTNIKSTFCKYMSSLCPWDIPKYFADFISVKYVMFMLQDNKYYKHYSKSNIESPQIKTPSKQTWLSFLSPFYVSYYMNTNGPNPKSKRIKRHNALVSTGREMENTVTGQHIPPNIFPHFYQTTKTNISFLHSLIPIKKESMQCKMPRPYTQYDNIKKKKRMSKHWCQSG